MFNSFSLPGIDDMNKTVLRLDHGRIGILAGGIFQDANRVPGNPVVANRDVKDTSISRRSIGMIINQKLPSVFQRNGSCTV